MANQTPSGRPWEPREQRLVGEFVREFFPQDRVRFQVRLGLPRPGATQSEIPLKDNQAMWARRPAADAVVMRLRETVIIEGFIKVDLGKVSQLQIYLKLAPLTPDPQWDVRLPFRGLIVGALEDPILTQHARDNGIEFVRYHPSWVDAYLLSLGRAGRDAPAQIDVES